MNNLIKLEARIKTSTEKKLLKMLKKAKKIKGKQLKCDFIGELIELGVRQYNI